jgi:hypothetical protein
MTIRIAKELSCDECAEWLPMDDWLMGRLWPFLKREGWTRRGGMHWCPACSGNVKKVDE